VAVHPLEEVFLIFSGMIWTGEAGMLHCARRRGRALARRGLPCGGRKTENSQQQGRQR
jgi:hypothetical protein